MSEGGFEGPLLGQLGEAQPREHRHVLENGLKVADQCVPAELPREFIGIYD